MTTQPCPVERNKRVEVQLLIRSLVSLWLPAKAVPTLLASRYLLLSLVVDRPRLAAETEIYYAGIDLLLSYD